MKLAFFYESQRFVGVFIYTFATTSAANISSYTITNTTFTASTTARLLLLPIMLLGIRPVLDFYKKVNSPITGPRCPEGSRKLRFPDYVTMAQDGGKVVSLTPRPLLPPGNTPGTHFC